MHRRKKKISRKQVTLKMDFFSCTLKTESPWSRAWMEWSKDEICEILTKIISPLKTYSIFIELLSHCWIILPILITIIWHNYGWMTLIVIISGGRGGNEPDIRDLNRIMCLLPSSEVTHSSNEQCCSTVCLFVCFQIWSDHMWHRSK